MSGESEQDAEQLSALADGELDPAGVALACSRWRAGEASHATWHVYHLIGDVLRSEDLASAANRDHAGLASLRARLANEPVIVAPASLIQQGGSAVEAVRTRRRTLTWGAMSAAAAGFAAVAGVLFVLRAPAGGTDSNGQSLAARPSFPMPASRVVALHPGEQEPLTLTADGKLVRDARLDRYLDAHKHFSGSSALGVPSSFLRGATSDASNR
jgi:sigma-E factor negative regulatory protein RseA